jgi:polyhydroxyalkanoate synthesis regulator phasin
MKAVWIRCAVYLFILAGLVSVRYARAGEIDVLLDVLVDKGVISASEAQSIRTETYDRMQAEKQKDRQATQEEIKKTVSEGLNKTMPVLSKTKFSGDMRVRYQTSETTKTTQTNAGLYRLRLRYGFEMPVNDQVIMGFRMASGSSADPSSTNQTFDNAFSKRALWIDRAYIQYTGPSWLSMTGGKMPNPFFTTDLVWDPDIVPEGFLAASTPAISGSTIKPFVYLGYFPVQENSSGVFDASLYAAQIGLTVAPFGKPLKIGIGTYNFTKLKGQKLASVSPNYVKTTNTLDGTGAFVYDYTPVQYVVEYIPWTFHLADHALPVKLYADFVTNTESGVKDGNGWLYGIKIGDVKKLWDFQVDYNYRKLEADAIPAFISDSDFHNGGTNCKGHKVNIKMGLGKNVALGATYFSTKAITGMRNDFNMWQIDFESKF